MSKRIRFTTALSTLTTPEAAGKYFARVINSDKVADLNTIAEQCAKDNPELTPARVKLVIRSLAATIRGALAEGKSVDTPWGYARCIIRGTLPSMDAAADEVENPAEVDFNNGTDLRAWETTLVGYNTGLDDESGNIKILDEEDASSKRKGVIVGTAEFVLTGYNLSGDGDGESLALVKLDGTLAATCSVTGGDGLGQRISARLATAVTAGKYKLLLTTHGYSTQSAPLQRLTKNVTVEAAG